MCTHCTCTVYTTHPGRVHKISERKRVSNNRFASLALFCVSCHTMSNRTHNIRIHVCGKTLKIYLLLWLTTELETIKNVMPTR